MAAPQILGEVSVLMGRIRGDPVHRQRIDQITDFGKWMSERGLLKHQIWTLRYLDTYRSHFSLLHHRGKIPVARKYLIIAIHGVMAQFEDEIKTLRRDRILLHRGKQIGGVKLVKSSAISNRSMTRSTL